MKKTKFWSLLALCCCLAGAVTLTTACGDDENPVNPGGQVDRAIVGDWVLPDSLNNPNHNPQYHFEANGTGYFQITMENEITDYQGDGTEVTHTWKQIERRGGNFTYQDNVLAFTYTYFENTFYEDGQQSDYSKEEFPRDQWYTDSIAPVVIRNNVMYIGETPWVKR